MADGKLALDFDPKKVNMAFNAARGADALRYLGGPLSRDYWSRSGAWLYRRLKREKKLAEGVSQNHVRCANWIFGVFQSALYWRVQVQSYHLSALYAKDRLDPRAPNLEELQKVYFKKLARAEEADARCDAFEGLLLALEGADLDCLEVYSLVAPLHHSSFLELKELYVKLAKENDQKIEDEGYHSPEGLYYD